MLHRVTKILDVYDSLKAVLGREKVANPKPDPDIYLAAAEALNVRPERLDLLKSTHSVAQRTD